MINFDNPVDFKANEERGIKAPTLFFIPSHKLKLRRIQLLLGLLLFLRMINRALSGLQLQIEFPIIH